MNEPPFLSHDLLNKNAVSHGFFTRHGGVSAGVYDSLNCGLGSDDEIDNVLQNRALAAATLGGTDDNICGLFQIHSNICHIANSIDDTRPEGDAIVTDKPHITLAILTADCVPVLFADHDNSIIGAAHAGWRGAVRGIISSTIETMEKLGANKERIKAVIGPAIQQQSYQVGNDLRDEVLSLFPQAHLHFVPDGTEKWKFDLPHFVSDQLSEHRIDHHVMTDDTYTDDRFFSHRRNTHEQGPDTGRLVSMIRINS